MKFSIIVLLSFFLLLISGPLAQANSELSITKLDTIPAESIGSMESVISNLQERVNTDSDTTGVVGTVSIYTKVKLYGGTQDSVNITKADIYITEGLYKNVRFYTESGKIFENKRYISVSSFRHQRNDHIYNINFHETTEYIILGDCMNYLWVNGNNFTPSDISFQLDTKNPSKEINVNAGLNSYVELRTYSDFLALINAEENGLVQIAASSRIIGYTRNIGKKRNIYFLNYIEPSIRYSKFDNDFEFLSLNSSSLIQDSFLVVDRTQLNQIAKLELQMAVNLIKYYTLAGHYIEFSGLTKYKFSDIKYRDTISTANLVSLGLRTGYELPRYKNFGIQAILTTEMQFIARNSGVDRNQLAGIYEANKWVFFWTPEIELYYAPLANKENKIYLKVSGVNSLIKSEKNYSQIQIGYRAKIKLN